MQIPNEVLEALEGLARPVDAEVPAVNSEALTGLLEALAVTWTAERTRLWKLAYSITRRVDLADDACSDAYLRVAGVVGGVENVVPYLYRTVRNCALDAIRKRSRVSQWDPSAVEGLIAASEVQAFSAGSEQEGSLIEWVRASCNPTQLAIVDAYLSLANPEHPLHGDACEHGIQRIVGVMVGLPTGTVKSALFHLRQAICPQWEGRRKPLFMTTKGSSVRHAGHTALWGLVALLGHVGLPEGWVPASEWVPEWVMLEGGGWTMGAEHVPARVLYK